MKRIIVSIFVFAFILAGCSSRKAVTGEAFNFQYDDQYYFNKSNASKPIMTASDDGYYFFAGPQQMYLYYMDRETMKPVIMCNKPDCMHTKETDPAKITLCNAFFLNTNCNMIMYDSFLYLHNPLSGSLYQVSLDATKRKEILNFKDAVYNMIIHRGYIYYVVNDNADMSSSSSKSRIYRINLVDTDKSPELIFECDGIHPMCIDLSGYGDCIFFKCSYFEDSKLTIKHNVIYRYDILRNNCEKFLDNAAKFTFYKKTILFCDSSLQLFTCELDGTEIKKMTGVIGSPFDADDKYIYLYSQEGGQRKLLIYGWDGNAVKSFDLPKYSTLYGGDNTYFFIYEVGRNNFGDTNKLFIIDKSQLADGSATLKNVYNFESMVEFPGAITGN